MSVIHLFSRFFLSNLKSKWHQRVRFLHIKKPHLKNKASEAIVTNRNLLKINTLSRFTK